MHLRHAAEAIGVLHPRIIHPVGLANLAIAQQRPQMRGCLHLAGMRPCLVNALVEGHRRAAQRLQRHSAGQIEEPVHAYRAQHRQATDRGHGLGSVEQRKPLLGFEHQGSETSFRQRRWAGIRAPSKNTSPSPISTRARCARGARSPLAPTEPLTGDDRVYAAIEQGDEQLDQLVADAAQPFG